ncbi:uncharacterized protein KY384_002017 [Bacidia gigantensis]|uniref:uncharacterized protein n=1 Tax=Bacidia gigantensis TaxID=2732470 RepID=UPI001D041147|nr:uncharacterized protein KY384_002017 [Bacidia gigantensis]KAG8533234.1 hypothetical protein KY384_002017 [Bacidia gigantensis]
MATPVDEGYFNDLSRQPQQNQKNSLSPQEISSDTSVKDQLELPKTKRIACVICRKRKLKCDGNKPKCATCARLGHSCAYDEVRRKSGPKRGYVKELEARLAHVETQLKGKAAKNGKKATPAKQPQVPEESVMEEDTLQFNVSVPDDNSVPRPEAPYSAMGSAESAFSPSTINPLPEAMTNGSDFMPDMSFGLDDNFSWEMIGLGLEEPLPMQEAIDELYVQSTLQRRKLTISSTNVYFEKIHPSLPMLHKYRYYSSLSLSPQARPPVCLRYAMWAMAAMVTDKYMHHDDIFYRRARKYLQLDEMKGAGESTVSLAHVQTWTLVATYEFKLMYFPRAWMSCGRAGRMALMTGMNRIDGIGMDVKQCLPPPKDWVEREERRRTFWMAYCIDRYASIGTGWPMSIDERDIMTALPASEEAYENGTPQTTPLMGQAMSQEQISSLSTFAGVVYVTHFFGLNLTHLHRPEPDDDESNLQGKFWKRHRYMDNILSNTSLALPSHLRLPMGVRNPNVVFINFSRTFRHFTVKRPSTDDPAVHTSIICLHQAAIFKAQRHNIHHSAIESSRGRCLLSAAEIVNIMRMTSHLDITGMNPYMVFCLYVAARVFVQFLKQSPSDEEVKTSLEFLLTAMTALRKKVPLAESFMIQLQLDIEGSGLDVLLHNPDFSSMVKEKAVRLGTLLGNPCNDLLTEG